MKKRDLKKKENQEKLKKQEELENKLLVKEVSLKIDSLKKIEQEREEAKELLKLVIEIENTQLEEDPELEQTVGRHWTRHQPTYL